MRFRCPALFPIRQPLIGVVHVLALPGTPGHSRPLAEIIQVAEQEAAIYRDGGVSIRHLHQL